MTTTTEHHERCAQHIDHALRCTCDDERTWDANRAAALAEPHDLPRSPVQITVTRFHNGGRHYWTIEVNGGEHRLDAFGDVMDKVSELEAEWRARGFDVVVEHKRPGWTPPPCLECHGTPSRADHDGFTSVSDGITNPEWTQAAARLAEAGDAAWCAACGAGITAQLGVLTGYWQVAWGDRDGTWVTATNQTEDRVELLIFDDEELYSICRGCGEPAHDGEHAHRRMD